jgi:four helix bundle protein
LLIYLGISVGTAPAQADAVNPIAEQLKERAMRFAIRVTGFCRTVPETWEGCHVRNQLFRSGTGMAANYSATCRARSRRDFLSKIGVVVEESDEAVFWLTFIRRAKIRETDEGLQLLNEATELLAIFTQSSVTASNNSQQSGHSSQSQ